MPHRNLRSLVLFLLCSGTAAAQPAADANKPDDLPLPAAAIARLIVDKKDDKRLDPANVIIVAVSPDSKFVATGENFSVRIFERLSGKEVRSFPAEPHQIGDLVFTPDGKGLLVGVAYNPARLWNLETGKETANFKGALGSVRGVWRFSFNPDASLIACAVPEPSIHLIKTSNGETVKRFGAGELVDRVAFSPDGKTIAAGGFNQALHLWDAASGKELWKAVNGTSIAAVAFAPNGKQIATGDYGSALKLWNPQDGKMLNRKGVGPGTVRTVAYSADSRLIAAAGDGTEAVLYEAATGIELRRLVGHRAAIWSLAFSPDGQSLVTGGRDGIALVWDVTGRKFLTAPAKATDADLQKMWIDLASTESLAGYEAVWKLVQLDKKAAAFLEGRLRAADNAEPKDVSKLIADLDDDSFAVREKATRTLAKLGKSVTADLQKALTKNPSAEAKGRLEHLLQPILAEIGDPRLQAMRALTVLEYMRAPEGRALLMRLADKGHTEEIRSEAAAALKRPRVSR